MRDEELQQPLIDSTGAATRLSSRTTVSFRRVGVLVVAVAGLLVLALIHILGHCRSHSTWLQRHLSGHVTYQATLKKDQQIEYAREFTAPCDYGILVFNVGPALDYLPYQYDLYEDAYVFSNNNKMCWIYPTYRGIQKGPFPWWVQGDPTSFDVAVGGTPQKISNRIVRPSHSKNITASKGGDFLIMAHHKFYTPEFYKNLKAKINKWTNDEEDAALDFGNIFEDLAQDGGEFEIMF